METFDEYYFSAVGKISHQRVCGRTVGDQGGQEMAEFRLDIAVKMKHIMVRGQGTGWVTGVRGVSQWPAK